MVRVNIISPRQLSDQHLIAEYNEILMLVGYVKKYPSLIGVPKDYCLGKGHIIFFKNKLGYLKKRHENLRKEMIKRGFKPKIKINLSNLPKKLVLSWKPKIKDIELIRKRIHWKIKNKQNFYRYYGRKRSLEFFVKLMKVKV